MPQPHVASLAALYALPPNTPVGSRYIVDDQVAMVVSGSTQDGSYLIWNGTTSNGKALFGTITDDKGSVNPVFYWDTNHAGVQQDAWFFNANDGSGSLLYYSYDDVADPSLCTNWFHADGSPASISIVSQTSMYELQAPRDTMPALIVAGGTLAGTFPKRGSYEGKPYYTPANDPDGNFYQLIWSAFRTGYAWVFQNIDQGGEVYYNPADTPLPPASGWLNASDDSPADITVTAGTVPNVAGYFVSGGTQDGIYSQRSSAVFGGNANKPSFVLLDYGDTDGPFALYFIDDIKGTYGVGPNAAGWVFTTGLPSLLLYSLDDVPTPDLCSTWYQPRTGYLAPGITSTPFLLNTDISAYEAQDPDTLYFFRIEVGTEANGNNVWLIRNASNYTYLYINRSADATPPTDDQWYPFPDNVYGPGENGNYEDTGRDPQAVVQAAVDSVVALQVSPVTQGELDANVNVDNEPFFENGISEGRKSYKRDADYTFVQYNGTGWISGDFTATLANLAFPWQADWSQNNPVPAVTRNDVASEANWKTVDEPDIESPVVAAPATATFTSGIYNTLQPTATNDPDSWAATGLPTGLSINPSTGLVSGTANAGTYIVTISATNAGGTGSKQVTFNINPATLPPPTQNTMDGDTSRGQLLIRKETAFSEALPGSAQGFRALRFTKENLKHANDFTESDEVRSDRATSDQYKTGHGVTGGFSILISGDSFTDILEAVLCGQFDNTTGAITTNTTLYRSFGFERGLTDIGMYTYWQGVMINTLALTIPSKGLVNGDVTVMGVKGLTPTATTKCVGGFTAANSNPVFTSGPGVNNIQVNGLPINVGVKEIKLNINNNLRTREVVDSYDTRPFGRGTLEITGSLNMYLANPAMYNYYFNNTGVSLSFTISDGLHKAYDIVLPRVKANDDVAGEITGNNADDMEMWQFKAFIDPVSGTQISVTQRTF